MQVEHYITLVGLIVTIFLFYIGQRNQLNTLKAQLKTQSAENQKKHLYSFQNSFWQKQLELYVQTTTAAAELTQFALNSENIHEKSRNVLHLLLGTNVHC